MKHLCPTPQHMKKEKSPLTWIHIGIIYSSRTIYLPSLKLQEQSVLDLSVAQGVRDQHDLLPSDLTINRGYLLIKNYLPTKYEASWAKCSGLICCTRCWETNMTFLPSDLTINRDYLLIKGYLPIKFEASGAKCFWLICCTRCGRPTWDLTYWPDYQ